MKVDESALTGESLAVTRRPGDKVGVGQGGLTAALPWLGCLAHFHAKLPSTAIASVRRLRSCPARHWTRRAAAGRR